MMFIEKRKVWYVGFLMSLMASWLLVHFMFLFSLSPNFTLEIGSPSYFRIANTSFYDENTETVIYVHAEQEYTSRWPNVTLYQIKGEHVIWNTSIEGEHGGSPQGTSYGALAVTGDNHGIVYVVSAINQGDTGRYIVIKAINLVTHETRTWSDTISYSLTLAGKSKVDMLLEQTSTTEYVVWIAVLDRVRGTTNTNYLRVYKLQSTHGQLPSSLETEYSGSRESVEQEGSLFFFKYSDNSGTRAVYLVSTSIRNDGEYVPYATIDIFSGGSHTVHEVDRLFIPPFDDTPGFSPDETGFFSFIHKVFRLSNIYDTENMVFGTYRGRLVVHINGEPLNPLSWTNETFDDWWNEDDKGDLSQVTVEQDCEAYFSFSKRTDSNTGIYLLFKVDLISFERMNLYSETARDDAPPSYNEGISVVFCRETSHTGLFFSMTENNTYTTFVGIDYDYSIECTSNYNNDEGGGSSVQVSSLVDTFTSSPNGENFGASARLVMITLGSLVVGIFVFVTLVKILAKHSKKS